MNDWILAAVCTTFSSPTSTSIHKLEMAQGAESKVEGLQAELAQAISERDQTHLQLQKERSRAEELEKQVCLCVCVGGRRDSETV